MPAPKNSLQAVLDRQAQQGSRPQVAPPVARIDPEQVDGSAKFFRPSREGRKLIAGHFDPKVAKQLKLLAAEEDTTVQALLEEALDLLFVKKGQGAMQNV